MTRPGAVVRIAERDRAQDGTFTARVSFENSGDYDVKVTDPIEAVGEDRLAWYFEEHLQFPFLDKDLEQEAVDGIAAYGRELFTQVFGDEANHDYRSLRDRAFDGCRIEISGSAAFQGLHWEALRDPDLPVPLAIRVLVTRRADGVPPKFTMPDAEPVLRILVVTARPDGPADIGYRTISRPLLESLRNAQLPVEVDLVRPGTWEALRTHLRNSTERHDSGWYQVAHFDLHGSFSSHRELTAAGHAEQLLFAPEAAFEGRRGFLYFETGQAGRAHAVAADEVANLLAEHRIPVAILNACQSAQQSGSEAGLAQRLAEAGVPVAVGMAYSVTVTAASRSMPVLYGKIAGGADPVAAVHAARRELFDHKARQAYYRQELDLEDWLLPVVFAQRPLSVTLRPMTEPEQATFYARAAAVGDEPATEYGFVGRDLDIQVIEQRVLKDSNTNELLLRGMAGAGKSTLLAHLAWWWQRTGLVDQVFSFSYEDRAWTAAQITREIRSRLMSPTDHATADSMPETAQLEQLARRLRSDRHLLILDNLESVTAAPAAIPHALTPTEQAKLKTLLQRLRGGHTLVLLGSREPETWLTAGSTGPATYALPGLDPQAASLLVEKILDRHEGTRHLADPAERRALEELTKLLGGYPLPLTVVLPVLATLKPSQVLAELKQGGTGADPSGLITRAIEYSHGKLDPTLQTSLLMLAPFTAVIPTGGLLDDYQQLLQQDEAVKALGPLDLAGALDQAVTVGLAAPHTQLDYLLQAQPVLPYFLRGRMSDRPALRAAADRAHYQLYSQLAEALHVMLASTDDPEHRAAGQAAARAEYANLTAALDHALVAVQPVSALIVALDEYLDQAQQHETRRQLLDYAIAAYPQAVTNEQQFELAQLHNLAGHTALAQHRLDDALTSYKTQLHLMQAMGDRRNQAVIYHQLGVVAQVQRRFGEAETAYRQALDILLEFGDRHTAASTYHQLGWVAQDQRRFGEAEAAYRQALDIYLEFGDRRNTAGTYHQLGWVAQDQRRFGEAEAAYRQALGILLEFGDRRNATRTYHQLGAVALERRRFDEAEMAYRRALDFSLEFGDRHTAAGTYHQLGRVAQEQGRLDEAEAAYRQALDMLLEFGDRHTAARTYHQLGRVAQEQGRLDEAEAAYRLALSTKLESGDRHTAASTFHQLGRVAQDQRRFGEAEAAYRQALDIYLEFADRHRAALTYHQLGQVTQEQRRFDEAEAAYRHALDNFPNPTEGRRPLWPPGSAPCLPSSVNTVKPRGPSCTPQ